MHSNASLLEAQDKYSSLSPTAQNNILMVGILFSAFLILSNLSAFKLAEVHTFIFPAGLIFFPITYIFDDILTEVYGFKISRRIIWSALFANLIVLIGLWMTTYLSPAPEWHEQTAYATLYRATPRIFIASTVGYFFGEFTNSIILAKLKVFTMGRHFWLRVITSSSIGVGIDTIFFMHIAFLFLIPYFVIWKIIFTMYAVKVLYEICALPLTYLLANYLKKKDKIDYYDFTTKFNPFLLSL